MEKVKRVNMLETANEFLEKNQRGFRLDGKPISKSRIKKAFECLTKYEKEEKKFLKQSEANKYNSGINNKYIDKVEIKRLLPNILKVSIIEKEIVANLYNEEIYCYIDKEGNFIDEIDENNKDNEVITVHIDYNKTDSQEIKFKNEENKKRLLYLLEYIKEEGIYKKIDNIDMTKPNSINMSTKEDINILLNSDEELKYNISRLAMILADLQNKKQKGGEIDLSTGKYALYRP